MALLHHPASAAPSLDVNTEAWRREQTMNGLRLVVDHIRRPNLPDEHGSLVVSCDPAEERAHRVGRRLHGAADAELTTAVIVDVEAELTAVQQVAAAQVLAAAASRGRHVGATSPSGGRLTATESAIQSPGSAPA